MPKPLTEEKRQQILDLHAQKLSRNEIARQAGVSPSSVSKVCAADDRTFDRTQTKDATRAKQVDLAEARMNLAHRMNAAANEMLDMLDKPFTVFNFGGKDNTFASEVLDSVPVDARRTIITSSILFDKISRIVEKDNGGLEQTVGVLDALAGNLTAAAELLRAQDDVPVGDGDWPEPAA
ncbi:helix-turn-helix domain-containing protein [Microterricola viridarii]|uniref:Helix-turn-helix domain-containing protein n=1 Tax=Microterricola viridarii TaxID=412690 RepID=A0A1H1YLV9_9MICO|nr:helix-turn-helix domain-containing protein [Microterricola viridarii]SDT22392.1 Helix-turn-helix domain-containing protein [Microterricola viridarii]